MKPARILVVEDEQIVAAGLSNRLADLGYEVAGLAAAGEEAVELAERLQPDLVLMDVRLEGPMDGVEAAGRIRFRYGIPVVYLTAYSTKEILERAKVTEPFGYILKPYHDRELHVVIDMALYRHRMELKLQETEEQFRQAQKMEAVGRLVGGVAHDFSNLLTIIMGGAEVVLRELHPDQPVRPLLANVVSAAERAARLIQQLLAFSRKQVLRPEVLDLNAVITETQKLLRRLIGEDVILATALAPGLAPVKADPVQIQQILLNLAVNARDAMPQGGTLSITTRNVDWDPGPCVPQPGPHILLAVSDTGQGMDEATRARIFEPYFTTKGPGRGTGLGLATVHGIVKQTGGHIEVQSAVGQGTTFRIYLPATTEQVPTATSPPELGLPRGRETVLLVEDDGLVRSHLGRILRSCGYTVLEAADGQEALRVSAGHGGEIALLITDVVMPRLGGRELAERLLAGRPGMRVLFLSGHVTEGPAQPGGLQSPATLLQKPFTSTAFAHQVRELLDRKG
jgi:signal transduction histidine kinase